jgi:hypothetical protein
LPTGFSDRAFAVLEVEHDSFVIVRQGGQRRRTTAGNGIRISNDAAESVARCGWPLRQHLQKDRNPVAECRRLFRVSRARERRCHEGAGFAGKT